MPAPDHPVDRLVRTGPSRRLWLINAALVVLFLVAIARFHEARTGFTDLIAFGEVSNAAVIPALAPLPRRVAARSAGYDGQFYVQMAMDPLLRDPRLDRALDSAALRARRILFAWTAYALGLGRPAWILQAYALQNVLAWLLLAAVLLSWFPPVSARHVVLWTGCLFSAGLAWSVRQSLLDGPSLLLLATGIALLERGRSWLSAVLFGIAGLGRETNLLALGAQLRPDWTRWRAMVLEAVLIVLPFVVWFDYLHSIYRSTLFATGESPGFPMSGFAWKAGVTIETLVRAGWHTPALFSLLALVAFIVQVIVLVARPGLHDPWWRLGMLYALLMTTLTRPLWAGDPGTAARVLLPLLVAYNVRLRLVTSPRWFWPLAIGGNLTVVQGLSLLQVPVLGRLLF